MQKERSVDVPKIESNKGKFCLYSLYMFPLFHLLLMSIQCLVLPVRREPIIADKSSSGIAFT